LNGIIPLVSYYFSRVSLSQSTYYSFSKETE